MHVCHVITRLIIGGAQENTVLTCRGLIERGHQVTLVAGPETGPEGSLWDQVAETGCRRIVLDSLRRAVHPVGDYRARKELARIFNRLGPDVVHTHSSKAGVLGRHAAKLARVPVVVHTIHGMSFNRTQAAPIRMLYRFLERRAARWTTGFITVADAMTDQAVVAGLGTRDGFTTIRSGIEVDRFGPDPTSRDRFRRKWGIGPEEIVVGTIARLFGNKGYEQLMAAMPEAVRREPKLRFVWVGDGALRGRYERQLEEMGLRDRVHLTGLIHPNEVASHISGFDILAHASRWEGLPRTLVQGLLCEVPVISFDNDGAPEVVVTDETGILVPYGDIKQLSQAMVSLAADPERRAALGRNGRLRCQVSFDWRTMVEQIEELYRKLAAR